MEQPEKIYKKWQLWVGTTFVLLLIVVGLLVNRNSIPVKETEQITTIAITEPRIDTETQKSYEVVRVVDGDTVDVSMDGKVERLRLIGINTPETVDPRKPVECFGKEASNKAKDILSGKKVFLENDSSQGERDKYDRLLRYVFLEDGTSFNSLMIKEGYAYEYTYDLPYKYQAEFKQAQKEAETSRAGLWGNTCNGKNTPVITQTNESSGSCTIKGNINSKKEKIYHVIGCGSYNQTVINESQGELWFCSEEEAVSAGWRKALNCN